MSELAERLKPIEDDFNDALATLNSVLDHVSDTKLKPALRVVISNNVIVTLISSIEETLRNLFKAYLTTLEERFAKHQLLNLQLQRANLDCGVQQLKDHTKDSEFKLAAAVVKDLSKCLNGERDYRLFKEQLTYNKGNFRSAQLTETAKNSGMAKLWNKICQCAEIEAYTGESVLDSRVTKLTSVWNAMFDERDLIVHQISRASGWGAGQIKEEMTLSLLVIKRVASCLVADLTTLIEQHERPSVAKPTDDND
ncbi:MAG: HEPN domain-containing protein [Candidatus Binataceae bacterium]